MIETVIRVATPADAVPLAALKLAAFRETFIEGFAIPYPAEDLRQFERSSYAPEAVAAELADPAHCTWVALDADGKMLAYAHAGPCKLPHSNVAAGQGELYQLYALAAAQGCGVGAGLMSVAINWLTTTMPGPVWLGVWSGNNRAQAFYARWGFVKVGEYGFRVGSWTDHEHIYRRD